MISPIPLQSFLEFMSMHKSINCQLQQDWIKCPSFDGELISPKVALKYQSPPLLLDHSEIFKILVPHPGLCGRIISLQSLSQICNPYHVTQSGCIFSCLKLSVCVLFQPASTGQKARRLHFYAKFWKVGVCLPDFLCRILRIIKK